MRCNCCKKEISNQQYQFGGLCGLCDSGACRDPERFHSLEGELERLNKK